MASSEPAIQFPHGRRAAVSLTYDDGIDGHLDHAMSDLESHGLRGTFYVPMGRRERSWHRRPDEWRAAVLRGHEIGNHTLNHPCGGPEHSWVKPENRLEAYTLERMRAELIEASHQLDEVFAAPRPHTYAYTCYQDWVGPERVSYRPVVAELFIAARGGACEPMVDPQTCDWSFVGSIHVDTSLSAARATGLIDSAIEQGRWAVLTFHGVGGGHGIDVPRDLHQQLCRHIASRASDIWCDTFRNVAIELRARSGGR